MIFIGTLRECDGKTDTYGCLPWVVSSREYNWIYRNTVCLFAL